jgi:hypothetical protein
MLTVLLTVLVEFAWSVTVRASVNVVLPVPS